MLDRNVWGRRMITNRIANDNVELIISDYAYELPIDNVQTFIIDPPYNIGYNYKGKVNDNLHPEDYRNMIYDVLELAYDSSNDDSSLFLINYPEIIFELYQPIQESRWNVHQWISWVYPSNIGHSKRKFTTAHRTVLWLAKDNPKVYMDRLTQPYKNPNDKRIKKLIESGRTGTHLYNWWEINMVKNVSKDKQLYVNQIPQELLMRLIVTTTDKGDLVADPMCGTASSLITADKLGRKGWGCDVNEDLLQVWREII